MRRWLAVLALGLGMGLAQASPEEAPPGQALTSPNPANSTPALPPAAIQAQTDAEQAAAPPPPPTLNVAQGRLVGKREAGVEQFLGVPYALPPLGDLRWKPPLPPLPWPTPRPATSFGAPCAQGRGGSEDCLTLNIYRPPRAAGAPLMVWVHGGFYTGGGSSVFDGSALAREYGVVVVTLNYRLGVLGFLSGPGIGQGNYGLMDIAAALRWLRANGAALGADPRNLTVFGNSAGGAAICSLMTAPSAAGLFDKAILQSGACVSPLLSRPLSEGEWAGQGYARLLRCVGTPEQVGRCLRQKPLAELQATAPPTRRTVDAVPLPPVYGSDFLPLAPTEAFRRGQFAKVPVLLGSNREEARIFEAYLPGWLRFSTPLYWTGLLLLDPWRLPELLRRYPVSPERPALATLTTLLTDQVFACPTHWLTRELSRWAPTYAYEFSDPGATLLLSPGTFPRGLGAYHGAELPYVLGSAVTGVGGPAQFSAPQARLAAQMSEYWTTFARTSYPVALGLTGWPPYTRDLPQVLSLAPGQSVLVRDFGVRHGCDFWDRVEGRGGGS